MVNSKISILTKKGINLSKNVQILALVGPQTWVTRNRIGTPNRVTWNKTGTTIWVTQNRIGTPNRVTRNKLGTPNWVTQYSEQNRDPKTGHSEQNRDPKPGHSEQNRKN